MSGPTPTPDRGLRLVLLATGDAPRSVRARGRLVEALERADLEGVEREEVDLTLDPAPAVRYRVFATPALLWVRDDGDDPVAAVLYGDLGDEEALLRFLSDGRPAPVP